jgi:glycosyltransferase involved in cell wall biosynthesis
MEAKVSTISVITPVHAPSLPHLADAYASLVSQELPPAWDWQWVVQEDGQVGILDGRLPDDARISVGQGRAGGPGVARTLGLARADGDLVKVLDADDLLTPGALSRDVAVLTQYDDIGWTTSRVLDLLDDGSTAGFEGDPPHGRIKRGNVLKYWREHNHRASVHPATLCIRRDLLLALGGWMALPASEDTGLLISANVVSDGYFNVTPGLLYRKWTGQATKQVAHAEPVERAARMRLIEGRATALASLGFGMTNTASSG